MTVNASICGGDIGTRAQVPPLLTGYDLNGNQFCVEKDCSGTNLSTNPSFESNLNGVTGPAGTLQRSTEQQHSGAYSVRVLNTVSGSGAVQFDQGLTLPNSLHVASAYIYSAITKTFLIQGVAGANVFSEKRVTIPNTVGWHRVFLDMPNPPINFVFRITGISPTSTEVPFYVDSVQTEQNQLTSYIDGSSNNGEWLGTPNNSASRRTGNSVGGKAQLLRNNYNMLITGVTGLSMAPVTNFKTPLSLLGGSFYQKSINLARQVCFNVLWCGLSEEVRRNQAKFTADINFDKKGKTKQTRFQYKPLDSECNADCPPVCFDMVYNSGMEGNYISHTGEQATVCFDMCDTGFSACSSDAMALNTINRFVGNIQAWCNTRDTGWTPLATNIGNGSINHITACEGRTIISGLFNPGNVAYANPDGTVTQVGNGIGSEVLEVECSPDGTLYAIQRVNQQTMRVLRFDGANWINEATVTTNSFLTPVNIGGLHWANNGRLYITGTFERLNGVASSNVAYRDTNGTWVPVTGLGTTIGNFAPRVFDSALADDGIIYLAGIFDTVNTIQGSINLAGYDTNTNQFVGLGNGINTTSLTNPMDGITFCNGEIWATGQNGLMYEWTGNNWIGRRIPGIGGRVREMTCCNDTIYVMSNTTSNQGQVLQFIPPSTVNYLGLQYQNSGIQLLDGSVSCVNDAIYISARPAAILQAVSISEGFTSFCNNGTIPSEATITINGPGRLQSLGTFDTKLFFDYVMAPNERLTISGSVAKISVVSNLRGDVTNDINVLTSGSDTFALRVNPCRNNFYILVRDVTVQTEASISWIPKYSSAHEICVNRCNNDECCNSAR